MLPAALAAEAPAAALYRRQAPAPPRGATLGQPARARPARPAAANRTGAAPPALARARAAPRAATRPAATRPAATRPVATRPAATRPAVPEALACARQTASCAATCALI